MYDFDNKIHGKNQLRGDLLETPFLLSILTSGLNEKLPNKTSESSETSVSDDVHDFFSSKFCS